MKGKNLHPPICNTKLCTNCLGNWHGLPRTDFLVALRYKRLDANVLLFKFPVQAERVIPVKAMAETLVLRKVEHMLQRSWHVKFVPVSEIGSAGVSYTNNVYYYFGRQHNLNKANKFCTQACL